MAAKQTSKQASQTVFGSSKAGPSIVLVDTKDGTVSALGFVDTAGVEHFLWFRTTGVIYRGDRADLASPETLGTAV